MAASTRSRVAEPSATRPFSTRDTVAVDTPAVRATSSTVAIAPPLPRLTIDTRKPAATTCDVNDFTRRGCTGADRRLAMRSFRPWGVPAAARRARRLRHRDLRLLGGHDGVARLARALARPGGRERRPG